MSKSGPIVLVQDTREDRDLFVEAMSEVAPGQRIICFERCSDCMDYLRTTCDRPFLIFCDINIRLGNGFDFKREIDADPHLRKKSIPFIFYTASIERSIINEAYESMTVQGFFKKESRKEIVSEHLLRILQYWEICLHPNNR